MCFKQEVEHNSEKLKRHFESKQHEQLSQHFIAITCVTTLERRGPKLVVNCRKL